jgi:Uncharacterized protein, possibly involved in glyoxylate utilization
VQLTIISGLALAILASGCATTSPSQAVPIAEAAAPTGPLHVTLLGNYVGKLMTVRVDGQVLSEGRLTFPPPGAEHRFTIGSGPSRRVPAEVTIEGCPLPWRGEIDLVPDRSAYLLIQGCQVEALPPD